MKDVYKAMGYASREAYLKGLSEEYGVDEDLVFSLAEVLGPNEDFDGLVTELEDM